MNFKLHSKYQPAGDQPKAIKELTVGLRDRKKFQTLLGVTGSGKTFTMANVIANMNRPTLVIAHNKTLAAQLCNEFREFFPENVVEYFVSYYDYYQPEAYMPRTDTYIEKEAMINEEIDRLRHAATQALLSRRDVIIVASVSCIYGLGSPKEYEDTVLHLHVGLGKETKGDQREPNETISRTELFRKLIGMQFERTNTDLTRGHFRAHGDVVEIMPTSEEMIYRLVMTEDITESIQQLDPVTRKILDTKKDIWIFPAKHYVISSERKTEAIAEIRHELAEQLKVFEAHGQVLEAERLSRRTRYDIEMIEQIGYCNGIENYSRFFDGRAVGEPPYTLIDYFPDDFLMFVDESHVSIPQIGGMYAGDQARKNSLIDHGFRLPSARDNRPLQFPEFEKHIHQVIFTSATPGPYELKISSNITEQIIRPTGLVDPVITVRPVTAHDPLILPLVKGEITRSSPPLQGGDRGVVVYPGQIEDLIFEIEKRVVLHERTLVTTLTKKMAEDLTEYLKEKNIAVQYLHSGVDTLDRITILSDLRRGVYDVLIGVNLLREGLDLPEVTLVAILDADKEGFLRSETSIIQTIGRAARHVKGEVLLYADQMTGSLKRAIEETERRRKIQIAHNLQHNITPTSVSKEITDIRAMFGESSEKSIKDILKLELTAETHEIEEVIEEKTYDMKEAARKLDFETATLLRDEIVLLKKEVEKKSTVPKRQKKK